MFDLVVPYESSGQQLGETRQAMAKTLMKDLEDYINSKSCKEDKFYYLVHAKPYPNYPNAIKIKRIALKHKPQMLLSCILFGVDMKEGKVTIEWALPGNWPTWSVGGTNEPVPEVIGSIKKLGEHFNLDAVLTY